MPKFRQAEKTQTLRSEQVSLWGNSLLSSTGKAFPPSRKDTGKMDFKWATIKSLYEMKLNWFYWKIRALWWSQPLERDVWLPLCKLTQDLYDLKQRTVATKVLSYQLFSADLHHPTLMSDVNFAQDKVDRVLSAEVFQCVVQVVYLVFKLPDKC